jgi:hypothetical protein
MARIDDIVSGKTNLPRWKVDKYRELYRGTKPPNPSPSAQGPSSESAAFAKYPCKYREKTVEQHTCRPCGGSRVHTICLCNLLDRLCTVRASDAWDRRQSKKRRVLCCLSCEHRTE